MLDIAVIIVSAMLSVLIALIPLRQEKGVDWYKPIGKHQKLIMFIVNVLIFSIISLIFFIPMTKHYLSMIIVAAIFFVFLFITVFLNNSVISYLENNGTKNLFSHIINYFIRISKGNELTVLDAGMEFLTIFNSIFALFIIVYTCYISYTISGITKNENTLQTLTPVFDKCNILVIAFSITLCLSLITSLISCIGWRYSEKVKSTIYNPPKNAYYYEQRIKGRGRSKE